ncbi:hypothetical protein A3G69_02135 [Candidatus Peribacteria bacterium RIFCSPLOWO2_12_FULL_53_10]|nr:MAG: hypothetical protein A3G69_02135 [Candidatus Peribacteria bacterium RIFCSPLOWO2_12_FULL_53_10]
MNALLISIDRFFFRRISASGFGLMRIAWAATALIFLLFQWSDVIFFYSGAGLIPPELYATSFRGDFRFTVFQYITNPPAVFAVYLLTLAALSCTIIGWKTRISSTAAAVLLFSFHERNLLPLGGGDTVLRNFGFLLMIAPQISAFSLDRARKQWKQWEETKTLLAPLTMSIWPWRLLLWQFIVIYIFSGLDKSSGNMWLQGTAVASALHHPHFARWPMSVMDIVSILSPLLSYATLVFEFGWLLMFVPRSLVADLPQLCAPHSVRRALLLGGVLFHGGIFVLMDVGSFSIAMLSGYFGLLLDEDFVDLRNWINRKSANRPSTKLRAGKSQIIVLYDAACRLCRRSMFVLLMLDHLHHVRAVNFRDPKLRKEHAPDIALKDLDRSMHITMSSGNFSGFDAFRKLTWHLPTLWPLIPLLYLPGIPPIGRFVYARIAASRNRCGDGYCIHETHSDR